MFCQVCGARIERGALACESCGAEQRQSDEAPARAPAAPPPTADPAQWVMQGPSCGEHPGMPLLGNCPRCGKQVCVRCAPDAVHDKLTCTECQGLSAAHKLAPAQAVCAVHPGQRAIFVCSRCGSFACAGCKPANDTLGMCEKCAGPLGTLASRGDRFIAAFVDNLVVGLLPVIAGVVGAVLASGADKENKDLTLLVVLGLAGVSLLLTCAAQLWAQITWGQSFGKRLTGIKVVRRDGSPIELWRLLLLRNVVVTVLSQACGLISIIDVVMIFTQDKRCLHDYLADSVVIDSVPGPEGG